TKQLCPHILQLVTPPLTVPPPRPTLFPYTTLFRSQTTRDLVTTSLTVEEKSTGEYRVQVDTKPNPQTRVFDGKNAWVQAGQNARDRKSTRLNSSHVKISYAVFCLKKKNEMHPSKYL